MNSEDLKPCPFCGGEAVVHTLGTGYIVECLECDVSTVCENTKAEAISAWNRRICVKQNSETLDTKSVASNPLNTKLTYADIKKMVQPLKWEQECEDGDYIAWVGNGLLRIGCRDKDKYSVFFDLSILQTEDSLEKAKQAAQEFFVDLVAAALGEERSGE